MRYRRTREVVIELTSLLDVVMILIFGVMIANAQLVEASRAELEEVQEENAQIQGELNELEGVSEELENALAKLEEGEVEELLARIQSAESRLDAYEYMDDVVVVFHVGLENKYHNTERCLTYGRASEEKNGQQDSVRRSDAEGWGKAVNLFKLSLQDFLKAETATKDEDKYIYIIFSIDESKVYANDFNDIHESIEMMTSRWGNDRVQYRLEYLTEEE